MSLASTKAAIYTWMQRETGITCIFANQSEARPALPYGVINFVNAAQRVGAIDELRAEGSAFSMVGMRTALVSLNIFGADANSRMAALRDSLDRPDVIDEFDQANISHVGENGPNDLTALEETSFVERSQIDLSILFGVEYSTEIDPIESVIVTDLNGNEFTVS